MSNYFPKSAAEADLERYAVELENENARLHNQIGRLESKIADLEAELHSKPTKPNPILEG